MPPGTRGRGRTGQLSSGSCGRRGVLLAPEIDVDALALEEPRIPIPREEDDDSERDALARSLVVEPVLLVRARHVGRLAHALWPDHDVRQLEVDVRERAEQPAVEARRALMAVPYMLGSEDFIDAVLGQRRQEAGQITSVLGLRVKLPELANGVVLGGVDPATEQLADVAHRGVGSRSWPRASQTTRCPPRGSPRALRSSHSSSRRCAGTAR